MKKGEASGIDIHDLKDYFNVDTFIIEGIQKVDASSKEFRCAFGGAVANQLKTVLRLKQSAS